MAIRLSTGGRARLSRRDAEIYLSFPGLGVQLGARVPAEIGDDPTRFADARALKAYAGSAPITRASGKKKDVGRRFINNDRLNHAGYPWAFAALKGSPGAHAHYRRRRDRGDWHAQSPRHLNNRLFGQLFHCLHTRQHFDEHHAFTSFAAAPDLATCLLRHVRYLSCATRVQSCATAARFTRSDGLLEPSYDI